MRRKEMQRLGTLALMFMTLGWSACGAAGGDYSYNSGTGGGEFGATQGGVQDMTLARAIVDEGQVPPASAFVVEAMFSEHDLPLTGEPCTTLLCLRGALGIAPDAAGKTAAWVQIGMSSTIDPSAFVRPSQTIVAVVDVSGSMSWGYGDDGAPQELSKQLLHAIADDLTAEDQFALVTFGTTSRLVLAKTGGDDQSRIHSAIDSIREDGSTNMEDGIRKALPIAFHALGETDAVRVMIFSDYNPNVGATRPSEFQQLVGQAADEDVGVTLFGLGLGLAPEVMKAMSELRGANAFSATSSAEAATLMEESWPWMACPIAYDLRVHLETSGGFTFGKAYGFPGEAGQSEADLEVATVFLSRKKGGMLVQLVPAAGADAIETVGAHLKLDYVTVDGEPVSQPISAAYTGQSLSDSGQYMPQPGIARATALALLVDGMQRAAELYGADPAGATTLLEAAVGRFAADIEEHGETGLQPELDFAQKLLTLMQQGAIQDNYYGGF